jgi:SNF2 family DNA or RNA helicase
LNALKEIQVSEKHQALVTPDDRRIENLFPHAKKLPDGRYVLPHNGDEVRVLRNLGYSVPSPVMSSYKWGGTKPFKAQVITTAMLVVEPRAYVLNTMGTGKTRSVLFAYDFLKQRGQVDKMLVAAPLSTLNFTWGREVFNVFPNYKVVVVHGPKAKRLKLLQEEADIYVINHDGLSVVQDELSKIFSKRDIFTIDEVAVFRSVRAKKHKVAASLSKNFGRVWGLTGTPTPREPTDAFGIIKLVNPDQAGVPKAFTHFRDQLMRRQGPFKWLPRPGAQERVFSYMQPSVRFTLEDCVDMPPIIHQDHEVELTPQQKKLYNELVRHSRALNDSGSITAVNEGVVLNKLLQVTTGAVFADDKKPVVLDYKHRLKAIQEIVDENDKSVIVFAPFVPLVTDIAEKLGEDFTVHCIHGGVSQKIRNEAFSDFQRGYEKQVIVAHPATMAHGLTLTAANLVLWAGPTWDLEIYEQANARIARPGQDADRVVIAHVMGSAIERKVYRRLQDKQKMQGALLELFS